MAKKSIRQQQPSAMETGNPWKQILQNDSPSMIAETKQAQAEALASILYGQGGEGFRGYAGHIQDHVLWLLADLIREAGKAAELGLRAQS